jgi:hypothetical protein
MILKILHFSWMLMSCYFVFRGVASNDFYTYLTGAIIFCTGGFAFQTINQWVARKIAEAQKEIEERKQDL